MEGIGLNSFLSPEFDFSCRAFTARNIELCFLLSFFFAVASSARPNQSFDGEVKNGDVEIKYMQS